MGLQRRDAGEKNRTERCQVVLRKLCFCPVVILPCADDEFDFIGVLEVPEILPAIVFRFAASRAFQVHAAPHAGVHRRDVERAAGFEKDREPVVTKQFHEWKRGGL